MELIKGVDERVELWNNKGPYTFFRPLPVLALRCGPCIPPDGLRAQTGLPANPL